MGEVIDDLKALKLVQKEKKWQEFDDAILRLGKEGIVYRILSPASGHILVIERVDFWPTTGRWWYRFKDRRGYGLDSLINLLRSGGV